MIILSSHFGPWTRLDKMRNSSGRIEGSRIRSRSYKLTTELCYDTCCNQQLKRVDDRQNVIAIADFINKFHRVSPFQEQDGAYAVFSTNQRSA
jgi:hypothetical protein